MMDDRIETEKEEKVERERDWKSTEPHGKVGRMWEKPRCCRRLPISLSLLIYLSSGPAIVDSYAYHMHTLANMNELNAMLSVIQH